MSKDAFDSLLHILVELSSSLSRDLVEALLLFNTPLIHLLATVHIHNVVICRSDRITAEEFLYSLGVGDLRVV